MKRYILILVTLMVSQCLMMSPADAVGFGYFFVVGTGTSDWEDEDATCEQDYTAEHSGFGFVLDTTVARNSLFNYQLTLGFENIEYDHDSYYKDWPNGVKLEGITMGHNFGFGVIRTPNLRIWIGPEIRMSHFEEHGNSDFDMVGFGMGPTMGFNINLGPVFTMAIKTGFIFTEYGSDSDEMVDDEALFFINGALLFRVRDTFHS
ncbi:hypothetical protein ACFL27_25495 [candidate division CSSED10-310 bacterium]|uniref:Outer membrane protein beta-barrel domain-containing protein n=1 Tax=candidate division CSSED10-310 bacterium TaxID=2855610 RepID=A0ABV6Z530_UNCC1